MLWFYNKKTKKNRLTYWIILTTSGIIIINHFTDNNDVVNLPGEVHVVIGVWYSIDRILIPSPES